MHCFQFGLSGMSGPFFTWNFAWDNFKHVPRIIRMYSYYDAFLMRALISCHQELDGNTTATPGARGGLQEQVRKLEELSAELEQLVREAGIISRLKDRAFEFTRHADQLRSELQRDSEANVSRRSSYTLNAEIDQNRKAREKQDSRRELIRKEIDALTRAQQVILSLASDLSCQQTISKHEAHCLLGNSAKNT